MRLRIHRKLAFLIAIGVVLIGVVSFQLLFPHDKLVPNLVIDGQDVSGIARKEATDILNSAYKDYRVSLFAGNAKEAIDKPTLTTIGMTVDNTKRVEDFSYPWYMRIIPSSLWWWGRVSHIADPTHKSDAGRAATYVMKMFGEQCHINPKDPTIIATREKIIVKDGVNGGSCRTDEVAKQLSDVKPQFGRKTEIRLDVTPIYPVATVADAEELVKTIESRLSAGVVVKAAEEHVTLGADDVRSWLLFAVKDDAFQVTIDHDKADETLRTMLGSRVAQSAGVTRVTTHDFTEIFREDGVSGRDLDIEATTENLVRYLVHGGDEIIAGTQVVQARTEYTRTYSSTDAGLSALIQHYAESKPGTYGVSLVELSGSRRRAGYNDKTQFITASTYKVYVAYAVLKRIEAGEWSWGAEIAGGRDVAKCFDDMIVLSDNPCAEAFARRIGYTPLHRDVVGLGMKSTSFIDAESYKTTAADLSNFMAMLEARQLPVSNEGQERLVGALKRNVYRKGIPAGVDGLVADKVGFLDGLLHDTAIVYSPKGIYVLTILTNGSSWANIAELTREIERLRN